MLLLLPWSLLYVHTKICITLLRIGIRSEDLSDFLERTIKGSTMALSSPRLVIPAAIYGLWIFSHQYVGSDFFDFQVVLNVIFSVAKHIKTVINTSNGETIVPIQVSSVFRSLFQPCLGCLCIKLPPWFKFTEIMRTLGSCFQGMRKATKCDKYETQNFQGSLSTHSLLYSRWQNQYAIMITKVCYAHDQYSYIIADLPFGLTEEDSSRGSSYLVSPSKLFECVEYKYAVSKCKSIL